ncbi:bifunctional diguanylate cyclase/phosphodiesterase [Undibacterium danionis]|uniref:EAL domain-containing protein n=1 Tax=Undibacterium danionis TaxID=1812100 RepID=A0ABV6IJX7_9BURK
MKRLRCQTNSIKTRVTLSVLVIFILSLWFMAFYTSLTLRQDMEKLLGEQQTAKAAYLANTVNSDFVDRFNALSNAAAEITPELFQNPEQLQASLERNTLLQNLFNAGTFITRTDGTALASAPKSVDRLNLNYLDRDYIRTPIETGQQTVGKPVVGKRINALLFGMGVAIRDAKGQVIGSLAGVTNLSNKNFLDHISDMDSHRSENYQIIAPQHQAIVSTSDKNITFQAISLPRFETLLPNMHEPRFQYGIRTNAFGDEEFTAVKSISLPNWNLNISLPAKLAFEPINAMQRRIIFSAILLTLFAAGFTWWILKWQLSPIFTTIKTISYQIKHRQVLSRLPIIKNNEIGQLIGSFNNLIQKMELRDEALKESEARFRTLTEMSSDFYWESDHEHRFISRTFSHHQHLQFDDLASNLIGFPLWEVPNLDIEPTALDELTECLTKHLPFREIELSPKTTSLLPNKTDYLALSGDPVFNAEGKFQGYRGIAKNISLRKQAEAEFRLAASAFDVQESMLITDANGTILRVNKAFTKTMGYAPEEIIGKMPNHLKSGAQDEHFYQAMWKSIRDTGSWQGEIWDKHKDGEVLPYWLVISAVKNAEQKITHYIGAHYDLSERKLAAERINHLSYFDQLTDLPNRQLLIDRLKQNMANSSRNLNHCALLSIDIDLKGTNDLLGHEIGDQLIQQVASRLNRCVREGDTVARIGGDEFIVMLAGLSDNQAEAASHSEEMATRIRAALNEIYHFDNCSHHSTANIGLSVFQGHQFEVEDLLKQVNLAMERAKQEAKSGICFFDPAMEVAVMRRAAMENDLHIAIAEHQFQLYYQAQLLYTEPDNSRSNARLTGAEVLLRWQHPERGTISPAEFIPLAEETGLILALGEWVLEQACQQLALWQQSPDTEHLTLAVNVSAHQFRQKDFVHQTLSILNKTGANPYRLKLELTESLLVSEVEGVIEKMFELKANGISFALDDFGTGYSSLAYLKRLPLDQLKIDQSFVRDVLNDPNDAVIVKTIIGLGKSLGLGVIAEGVESALQKEFLLEAGCHAFQGYFFSKPLTLDGFEHLYRSQLTVF